MLHLLLFPMLSKGLYQLPCLALNLQMKKIDFSKLKAIADNNLNMALMIGFVFNRLEKIMGTGENACYQQLLIFLKCLQKASIIGSNSGLWDKCLTLSYC